VFELNYESGLTQELMKEVIINLVNMGIDGFRCDMAHLVPESFWAQVITKAKTINSKIWFGAEAYEQSVFSHENRDRLIRAGFEAMYDSGLYENIKAMRTNSEVSGIVSHLNYVNQFEPGTWIHYFGNHDDSFPLKAELTEVYAALISSLKGSWLIFNGSLSGQNHRLAHHYIEILEEGKTSVDSVSLKLKQFLKRRNELGPIVEEFVAEGHTIRAGASWFDLESGDYGY